MERGEKRKSELEGLLVDAEEGDVDRRLREVLEGRVAFERGSGRVLVRPGLFRLRQRQRVLILLLARHALVRLGVANAEVQVDPGVLANESQVSLKSVREYLSRLKAKGMVEKGPRGYELPAWNILLVADELKAAGGE